MSISSMTGFGRADGTAAAWSFLWEVRSVNGKGLDVRMRTPPGMDALEQQVRALAAKHLKRGNVQMSLQLTSDEAGARLEVNEDVLAQAVAAAEKVSTAMDGANVSADAVFAMRGVVETVSVEADDAALEARDKALLKAAEAAIVELVQNRRAEGERLSGVVGAQLDQIAQLVGEAAANASRSPEALRARLSQQIERLTGASPALEPDRLHQEAVMLAVKADIQEELDRLEAHVSAARELLQSDEPVGRKLDFLAQEFNREANTLCSKSSDTALTRAGLELKNTIDQLREQVQNIE